MPHDNLNAENTTLRDELAMDRTRLANERTFLAYTRTAIMLLLSGVTLMKLFPHDTAMVFLGLALLPLGAATGLFGVIHTARMNLRIRRQSHA